MSATAKRVYYPDDDGLPMSDNTWQFNCIVLLHSGLEAVFAERQDVFVAGNHLIYPVKGRADVRQAPDVYVAFGAPKFPRGSYKVWEENDIFPQVVFEVWSPNNRLSAMEDKREFYERYGAEEYYIVYPEFPSHVDGWRREGDRLVRLPELHGFVSPRLGIRFEVVGGDVKVYGPDGRPFLAPAEIAAERAAAERAAEEERQRATEERDRAARLAAKLRELGVDPDAI
ncbi:MAG TPA: Uma2 family endonuclease [Urbifossiella sp.]|nr:Uma2 family endonuclease [Urbifossiella sp.]